MKIRIHGDDGITRLPKLDDNITVLDLHYCTNVTSLPEELPAGLTTRPC